jgi:putative ATP-dependent endonuclease of the OLD family
MALHVAKVSIQNFRNFSNLVIDPFPPTAVIVGENNVGKTNLLYALRLILDPDLPDSARRLREEDIFDGSGGFAVGVIIRIAIELADFADDSSACSALYDCYMSDSPPRARLEYIFEPREPVPSYDDESEDAQESPVANLTAQDYDWRLEGGRLDDPRPVRTEPRRYIGLRVLPALRDASDELTRRRSPLRELLGRLTPGPEVLTTAAADINKAMDNLLDDKSIGDLQRAIRSQSHDMVGPAFPVTPTLGIAPTIPDQLLRQIRLFTDSGRRRGLNDTSIGTANVLYLALLMEAVRQRRSSTENVATILGVEEPEAHLHVQVQRRIFGYLLRNEPALLLTSHSPHIAAVAPLQSIVLLRNTAQGSVATTAMGADLTAQQRADLERYMDATRAELLFARCALLVEGDAERYLIPALAHAANFDLDEYGISIISVQGTDFFPFRNLLGSAGLQIPNVIVTDGDKSDDGDFAISPGVRRGLRLCNTEVGRRLNEQLDPQSTSPLPDGFSESATQELDSNFIYVGDVTLEIDLARIIPDAFDRAFSEFLGVRSYPAQRERLRQITSASDTAEVREEFINRIERVGKGRFAQRLAGEIGHEEIRQLHAAIELRSSISYVGRALDLLSRATRGHGLSGQTENPPDHEGHAS